MAGHGSLGGSSAIEVVAWGIVWMEMKYLRAEEGPGVVVRW